MKGVVGFFVCFVFTWIPIHSSRVLELTDRFPEIRKETGLWLVHFYAPWCGHCKKLEPIWMHVAQALAKTNIKVGKLDAIRFPNVAQEFKTYGTPTIKFIKSDEDHTYTGERTKEAIVDYAMRMAGPPVQEVRQPDSVNRLKSQNQLFFMFVGQREGQLWDTYYFIAKTLQPHSFFYSISKEIHKGEFPNSTNSAIYVHKDGETYWFEGSIDNFVEDYLMSELYKWINVERFSTFPRISAENIKEVMQTEKYLVLAIVDENKVNHIPPDMIEFRNKVETLIRKKRHLYHKHFQFGWMGNADLANSILMDRLELPYLLVLNSTTYHHHIPEDDPAIMTLDAIEDFLQSIINRTAPPYGGNSVHINVVRKFFDLRRNLEDMWKGNPILLMVLFTLPSLFFLLILWACCCSDIMDADENEEEEELLHEKKE
ncbi:protein disulfide-isomerase TMX3 [Anthonomus grandis grandis]|uniref:protein disulfide-isomerase TMX3 n=1 Tax=Anthonomus grandis grandis TaxID=2921223 RepID=UPI002165B924|nr:protein disulfide-isomerase TMX3 [Anthonomus grandis grandis]